MASSPYPGLVRVEDDDNTLPTLYDLVYALQWMPQCKCMVVMEESIKGIAREVLAALLGDDNDDDESITDDQSEQQRQRLLMTE